MTAIILFYTFALVVNQVSTYSYTWLETNDLYDCVVGILVNNKPAGVGVLMDRNLVLTSATVVEDYVDNGAVSVAGINGEWNRYVTYRCACGITPYRVRRSDFWMSVGADGHHCPLHDLFILYCPSGYEHFGPESVNATYRKAFSTYLARPYHHLLNSGFITAGFGYVDQDHVEKMDQLEVDLFGHEYQVDCDDFVPRQWGRFICINHIFHTVGVQSGTPLFHRGLIFGIGCFSLEKGDEKILVFTDIRDYSSDLFYCINNREPAVDWWSRYWENNPKRYKHLPWWRPG